MNRTQHKKCLKFIVQTLSYELIEKLGAVFFGANILNS